MARLVRTWNYFFDPLDVAAPFFSKHLSAALDDADSLREALLAFERARTRRISRAGEGEFRIHAAFLQRGRTPEALRSRNGKFYAGHASFTLEEMRAAIEKTPKLLRPTCCCVQCSGHAASDCRVHRRPRRDRLHAQAQIVYEKLLGRMPRFARASLRLSSRR